MTKLKPLIPLREKAVEIGIPAQSLYYFARQGHLNDCLVRLGRKLYIDPDRFDQWVRNGGSPQPQKDAR